MDELLEKLLKQYPFLSHIQYAGKEYIGIIQNRDAHCTSFYDYERIGDLELKKHFLQLAETWWWESNRMIPINIFLQKDMLPFRYCQMTMNTKDVKVTLGPTVNLNKLHVKRVKRKSVQLLKKPKN